MWDKIRPGSGGDATELLTEAIVERREIGESGRPRRVPLNHIAGGVEGIVVEERSPSYLALCWPRPFRRRKDVTKSSRRVYTFLQSLTNALALRNQIPESLIDYLF